MQQKCHEEPEFRVRLVAWHSGRTVRTPVFDRRTYPVPRSTCSRRVTTYAGKPSAIGQPTRPTQPFILAGSINKVVTNFKKLNNIENHAASYMSLNGNKHRLSPV